MSKRAFDIAAAFFGILLLSPLFAAIALWIRLDSKGPVFFRQVRVARGGRHFRIFKFRTMKIDSEARGLLTTSKDGRITRSGAVLRKFKLDELPQLLNVLLGDMSLVGPRPEVPKYVAHYPEHVRAKIFSVRPGITDLASIKFRNENDLLDASSDPENVYINEILPQKLALSLEGIRKSSLLFDVRVIFATIFGESLIR